MSDPSERTDPSERADPSEPADPSDPADPSEPAHPSDPADRADAAGMDAGIGAVPTWDWRAGTSFASAQGATWAPQPLDAATRDAWPSTEWASQTTSWASPSAPRATPSVDGGRGDDAAPAPAPQAQPQALEHAAPEPPASARPAPESEPPSALGTASAEPPPEIDPAWLGAGRVEPTASTATMPRTIVLARRTLWIAMGLAVAGLALTTLPQLAEAASRDVAPSSSGYLRNLGGTAIYVALAALGAASAKRRRSGAIAAAALLAVVSCTGMGFLTIAPLPAALAALALLLLPTSRAWLTIHPERIRRLLGDP